MKGRKKQNKSVGATIPFAVYDEIEQLIFEGRYSNMGDFIRQALRLAVDREIELKKEAEAL